MFSKYVQTVVGFAMAIGLLTAPAGANLIANGSFENGNLPTPSGVSVLAGGTNITDWIVGGGGVDYIGTLWQAADGTRSIDMDSGKDNRTGPFAGSLSQSFATTSGQLYAVDFDLAGNPDGGPILKTVAVSAAGQTQDFSFTNTVQTYSNMGYLPQEFLFTANSSSTTLMFASLSGTGYGPVIDNVVVSPVPEPASLMLVALSLLPFVVLRRRTVGGNL